MEYDGPADAVRGTVTRATGLRDFGTS